MTAPITRAHRDAAIRAIYNCMPSDSYGFLPLDPASPKVLTVKEFIENGTHLSLAWVWVAQAIADAEAAGYERGVRDSDQLQEHERRMR